jgi:hypothetical protein
MPAPIALELVATPPQDVGFTQALVDSCSGAAGPGGCVLAGAAGEMVPRARVVVTFSPDGARIRVEVLGAVVETGGGAEGGATEDAAGGKATVAAAREVGFREDDPPVERLRAAGLVAAGLVSDLARTDGNPARTEAMTTSNGTARREGVVVRLGGAAAWNDGRPWIGAELGGDFGVVGPWFVALSGVYGQTWARDPRGIAEQRTALGVGGGADVRLASGRLELRVTCALDLQEVRASIVQPMTGREDAGARALAGADAGLDLVVPIGSGLGVFAGARLGFLGDATAVRVAGQAVETIQPWAYGLALGLNARLP